MTLFKYWGFIVLLASIGIIGWQLLDEMAQNYFLVVILSLAAYLPAVLACFGTLFLVGLAGERLDEVRR